MKAAEIRSTFLKYFESKGHQIVASSPVVPGDDPTLLFTNAGMNQFKDVFLGFDKRPYSRAATSQKCIRAGGKHNDLENVGYTARHHTFFEMLGNFSFGDYFKRDAIKFAWELLTVEFKLPAERLWATVYAEDDEAYDIWLKEIGLPAERIVRIGDNKGARYASDNFWMMGDTGPCGPCSEIFFDHGPDVAGGPPGSPDEDGDRYIEIWNNVFMQFNRTEDGVMHPLPKPSVDTGMGLERITAVMQHVHSNYEIDLFVALLTAAKKAVDAAGAGGPGSAADGGGCDKDSASLKVIADHIRACSFTIADGVIPGNEGRGYVLRRIARRAIRHGYKLGARKPFFHTLVAPLAAEMGGAYPELARDAQRITAVLKTEEERFFQTIANGMEILESALVDVETAGTKTLDGELAFKLHDTYGFPLDLTADVCRERGVTVDEAAFNLAMNRQREQARAAGKFKMAQGLAYSGVATAFHGYDELTHEGAKVTALYLDGAPVQQVNAGDDAVIVLDHTPFYAESGGQVGDTGELRNATARVRIEDTTKIQADVFGHQGRVLEGSIKVGDALAAKVDAETRARTVRNHSATHLMHKALREVLGAHVAQKGSLVNAERTRFDFSHNAPLSDDEIRRIEQQVNAEILANAGTQARVMTIDDAQKLGAMMLFGEKYGDTVRVLDIGSSRELCGGVHVQRTGDIGLFKIVAEGGVAAGVRRVEAVTGAGALAYLQSLEGTVSHLAGSLKVTPAELEPRVAAVLEQVRALEKEIAALKGKLASAQGDELMAQAVDVGGLKVLAARLEGADAKTLRDTMDKLKDKLKSAAIVLAAVDGDKVQLAAGVTADVLANTAGKLKAGELVNFVAQQVGGKGGGKPDLAMAGGTDASKLAQALASVRGWVAERV
ncbi:alanine--tRNA ligase [Rivibacter subsaxonicus]|uniref:Alanine--tRNA ligase n=1 Tax=Rivibacter subsaxonicus TaxID=457575 RepID=A0A4Q7VNN8_9BURK|nr:alanine--tRNA ligase [Rivibacter subsaxonicus]RZT98000.1 alanyl-tRNA synthetase [Rivibacter subsaxonicus]